MDQATLPRRATLTVSAASEEGTVVMVDIPRIHQVSQLLNELVREIRDHRRTGG